jgi:hypothetical protein
MGYDLSQINGSAFWSGGMATMGRLRDALDQIGALAPYYPFETALDAFLDEIGKSVPTPRRKHFTRVRLVPKTEEARAHRARLYEGLHRIKSARFEHDERPPVNKFIGNAGWVVTPVECESLLRCVGFKHVNPSFAAFVEAVRETGFTVD